MGVDNVFQTDAWKRWQEIGRKVEYDLFRGVPFDYIEELVLRVCKEVGFPPVELHRVNSDHCRYYPYSAILRETTLPKPRKVDREQDIGYVVGRGKSYNPSSFEINHWAMDDALREKFYWKLHETGLRPWRTPSSLAGINDLEAMQREDIEFKARTPRYRTSQ